MTDAALQEMCAWFFANYEPVEENTPRDSGEWVYIWGEPVENVADELHGQFAGRFSEAQIEAAATHLEEEHDVCGWVPVPTREEDEASEDEAEDEGS